MELITVDVLNNKRRSGLRCRVYTTGVSRETVSKLKKNKTYFGTNNSKIFYFWAFNFDGIVYFRVSLFSICLEISSSFIDDRVKKVTSLNKGKI